MSVPNKTEIAATLINKVAIDTEIERLTKMDEEAKQHPLYSLMYKIRIFDLFYDYSDDGGVFRAGVERERKLKEEINDLEDLEMKSVLLKGLSQKYRKEFDAYVSSESSPLYALIKKNHLVEMVRKDYVMVLANRGLGVDHIHYFRQFQALVIQVVDSLTPKYAFVKGSKGPSTKTCLKIIRERGYGTPAIAVSQKDEAALDRLQVFFRRNKDSLVYVFSEIGYESRGVDLTFKTHVKGESVYLLSCKGIKLFVM